MNTTKQGFNVTLNVQEIMTGDVITLSGRLFSYRMKGATSGEIARRKLEMHCKSTDKDQSRYKIVGFRITEI